MNVISRLSKFTVAIMAAILSGLAAKATPITVPNASFENPTTPTGGDGAPIPGWVFNSQSGNLYGTSLIANSFTSKGAASGNNYAWMLNDVFGKTDTITSASSLGTIAANTSYTLTVAIGNVAGSDSVSNHSPGNVSFSLLANGVAFATDTVPNGTVPDGTFEDFSLTFQTPSASSIIGDSLEIQLASLPTSSLGYGPAFDNVTLDATPIAAAPEPSTCVLLLGGLLTLAWFSRRRTRSAMITVSAFSLAMAAMAFAHATPMAIPNASFGSPTTPVQSTTNNSLIPGWTFNVPGGGEFGTLPISTYFSSPGAASGSNFAFIDGDNATAATITSSASLGTITASTQYTLTVALYSTGYGYTPISFALLGNGAALATDTVNTSANGTFTDYSLTYDSPTSGSAIGEDLTIQLEATPMLPFGYAADFANVTLDATPLNVMAAPEPPTTPLLIAGGLLLFWLFRQRQFAPLHRSRLPLLLIVGCPLCFSPVHGQAIKTLPLDDQTVYQLKVGTDKVTTLVFPQPITALEGSGLTSDAKTPAKMLLSYHAGDRFLSLRSLADSAAATLNVIISRKVYVLELSTDKDPVQSLTFYPADEPPAQSAGQPNLGPSRLLGLLDKAKAYPLLAEQYPEMVSQIDEAEPFTQTLYEGFHVILTKVFRFDAEDALIFQVELVNETDKPIYYIPQSLAVRVGSGVYWSALSDASGIIPPGQKDPKSGQITPGQSNGYFVICGTPHGGRNHLSVQNNFNVLVFRQENP